MNLFKQHPLVDIQKLEDEIHGPRDLDQVPREASVREPKEKDWTPLQYIAYYCTQLCYKDAVAMGEAIQAKLAAEPSGSSQNVTAAIQSWAQEWEDHK